ncbi:MAG: hypothetical protein JO214_05820 [Frankiaceae bacterium]|nr:hypothetical protein [Frankiaceae bacterium]
MTNEPEDLFDTPEEAALSGWAETPSAQAKVVEVDIHGDRATVIIEVAASRSDMKRERNYCHRSPDGRWMLGHSEG